MKTLILFFILIVFNLVALAQNIKCLAFSNKIIENTKGKMLCNSTNEDVYCMKAGFAETYDLETMKSICDTTSKTTKVSFNWRINYDKNYEKEFIVSGKKLMVTIYFNDRYLYFEFPKE